MTHTEESLMALADFAIGHQVRVAYGQRPCNASESRNALRLAIRKVLAERDSCAGQLGEAIDQRDRQARRAERAEAENLQRGNVIGRISAHLLDNKNNVTDEDVVIAAAEVGRALQGAMERIKRLEGASETAAWMICEPGCEYGPTFGTENAAWSALTKAPPGSELIELIRRPK